MINSQQVECIRNQVTLVSEVIKCAEIVSGPIFFVCAWGREKKRGRTNKGCI